MKIDDVIQVVNQIDLEPEKRTELIEKIAELEQVLKAEKSSTREKKSQREMIVCLKSPHDLKDLEIVATVFSGPEGFDVNEFVPTLRTAAVDHNLGQRKKKTMITDFTSALNSIKPKFLNNHGLKRVTGKDWWQTQQVEEALVSELPSVDP